MWPSSLLSWRESRWSGCLDQGGVPLCLPEGNKIRGTGVSNRTEVSLSQTTNIYNLT